jgi:hypothetical protein
MVKGLVYTVVSIASGRLTRKTTAQIAAPSICRGPGIRPQNMPAATAPAAEWRLRSHNRGCSSVFSKGRSQRLARIASWSGRYLRRWRRMDGGQGLPQTMRSEISPMPSMPPLT